MKPSYRLQDYQFDLPAQRIAQVPAHRRDQSRLLVAEASGKTIHTQFRELGSYLRRGDVLVLNKTQVVKARCRARKANGTPIEVFFVDTHMPEIGSETHLPVMFKPARRLQVGTELLFERAGVHVQVTAKTAHGRGHVSGLNRKQLDRVLALDGETPLPPYIKRPQGPTQEDLSRYQTVYASEPGAVAAPTAGLHFTRELLDALVDAGIDLVTVTHHVGAGTFKPVTKDDIRDHVMDAERYVMTAENAAFLTAAKQSGRRLIAVGTTCTRCLEANFDGSAFRPGTFTTDLYIFPGYRFRVLNGLVTNFHLPGSSLILLVAAFLGRERVLNIYRDAIARRYRFYSYGDAMLLIA